MTTVQTLVPAKETDQRSVSLLIFGAALLPALILGVIVGLVAGAVAGAVVAVVVAAGLLAVVVLRAGKVSTLPGGAAAVTKGQDAEVANLIESLSLSLGVRAPELRVLDSRGANVAVAGWGTHDPVIVITSKLRDSLSTIQLEGVLARALVALKAGDTETDAYLSVTGWGVDRARKASRDLELDAAAANLTRYPPGLADGLAEMGRIGTVIDGVNARSAHLWLADPSGSEVPWRIDLATRIAVLHEL